MSSSCQSAPSTALAVVPQVVRELLASYQELQRYLHGRLRNRDQASDIAQSSFAQAYAYVLDRPIENARALLFQIARNLCVDTFRRQDCERDALEAWDVLHSDALAPSAEEIVAARQELKHVIDRIERMPRLRRDVFVRIRLHGQTHREVCEALQLKPKAVEQHIARAVFDLSEMLVSRRTIHGR